MAGFQSWRLHVVARWKLFNEKRPSMVSMRESENCDGSDKSTSTANDVNNYVAGQHGLKMEEFVDGAYLKVWFFCATGTF